jgi:hypothetical protein
MQTNVVPTSEHMPNTRSSSKQRTCNLLIRSHVNYVPAKFGPQPIAMSHTSATPHPSYPDNHASPSLVIRHWLPWGFAQNLARVLQAYRTHCDHLMQAANTIRKVPNSCIRCTNLDGHAGGSQHVHRCSLSTHAGMLHPACVMHLALWMDALEHPAGAPNVCNTCRAGTHAGCIRLESHAG